MEAALLDSYQDPNPGPITSKLPTCTCLAFHLKTWKLLSGTRKYIDPGTKLPEHYHMFLPLFDQKEAISYPLTAV